MTRPRSVPMAITLALVLALGLTACGSDDEPTVTTTSTTSTTDGATGTSEPTDTTDTTDTTTDTPATALQGVAVMVEGQPLELEAVCAGADGAVVTVDAATGRLIILVREEGLALRLSTEGETFSETGDVTETDTATGTRYEGTVPVEGQPTPVRMDIADGAEAGLGPC